MLFYRCSFLFFAAFVGWVTPVFSQTRHTISGHIRDAQSGETLIGASIRLDTDALVGARANNYGFYSLTIPEGSYTLVVSHVGYQSHELAIKLTADTTVNIELHSGELVQEVVISQSASDDQVRNPQMGLTRVNINEIKHVPVLMGEKDLLKTIQLLPGVLSGGEGSSNFFVRGGAGDQNLI